MATIHIDLPDELIQKHAERARQLGFSDMGQYYQSCMDELVSEESLPPDQSELILLSRLESGKSSAYSAELMDSIKREYMQRHSLKPESAHA